MKKLLIATKNVGKFKEITNFLSDLNIKTVSLGDIGIKKDICETGKNYRENSQAKALFYAKESNLFTIADDGGIEIDAFDGAPGIKSKRWLGKDSTEKDIVNHMVKIASMLPNNKRRAKFKTVISFAKPCGKVFSVTGEVGGIIAKKSYLKTLIGYPYRSFFYLPQIKKYYHEDQLTQRQQKEYNHRYKAINKLKPILIKEFSLTP